MVGGPPQSTPESNLRARTHAIAATIVVVGVALNGLVLPAASIDSMGHEFWAVNLPNAGTNLGDFGIGVVNPSTVTASVTISEWDAATAALVTLTTLTVPPGASATATLPTVLKANTLPGLPTGSGSAKGVVHIESNVKIIAEQMVPIQSEQSNDASLLLAFEHLSTEYDIITPSGSVREAFATVVATTPNTKVTWQPSLGGVTTGLIPSPGPLEITLQRHEAFTILSPPGGDLTGARVVADNPVAVFAGATCANQGPGACDHMSEQIWPTTEWDQEYVACRAAQRSTEATTFRILALRPGSTDVDMAPGGYSETLLQGQWLDFTTTTDTVIVASQQVAVAEIIHGDPSSAHTGDPSFVQVAPTSHFGLSSTFMVPPGFPSNHVVIAADSLTDVAWADTTPITSWAPIGSTGFKCSRTATAPGAQGLVATMPAPGTGPGFTGSAGPCPGHGLDDPGQGDPITVPEDPDQGDEQEDEPLPPVFPPEPPQPDPDPCPPDPPHPDPAKPRGFAARVYGYDTYGSYGFPAPVNETAGLPQIATYAAGDLIAGEILVTGNDPGCGLGDADSNLVFPADRAFFVNLTGGSSANPLPPAMTGPRFLHGAASISWPGGEALWLVGGADDCDFVPRKDTEFLHNDASYGLRPFSAGPDLHEARIAPAAGSDFGSSTLYVVGGDTTGLDPNQVDIAKNWHVPSITMESLDTSSGQWASQGYVPAGMIGSAAMFDAARNQLVVSGGMSHPQVANRGTQIYDIDSATWVGDHLEVGVTGHVAESCQGQPYVFSRVWADRNKGTLRPNLHMHSWHGTHPEYGPSAYGDQDYRRGLGLGQILTPTSNQGYDATYYGAGAVVNDRYFVTSGGLQLDTPHPPSKRVQYYDCTDTSSTINWIPMTDLPEPVAQHGMEAIEWDLWTFGGSEWDPVFFSSWSWDYHYDRTTLEILCPTDDAYTMPFGGSSWTPISPLPVATASMGTAVIDEEWIALVGGRVAGLDDSGTSSCLIPYDGVWFYNTILDVYAPGPTLPEGLIGPAVTFIDGTLYVAGGDETGERPVPADAFDDRERRPSTNLYALDIVDLELNLTSIAGGNPLIPPGGVFGWYDLANLPVGVVNAEIVLGSDNYLHVIGGNHHPNATVRMDQVLDIRRNECILGQIVDGPCPVKYLAHALGLPYESWVGPHLAEARAHHAMEFDMQSSDWSVYGGLASGPLYYTAPGVVTFASSNEVRVVGLGPMVALPNVLDQRAFPVGVSGWGTYVSTGTTPDEHRTLDVEPMN